MADDVSGNGPNDVESGNGPNNIEQLLDQASGGTAGNTGAPSRIQPDFPAPRETSPASADSQGPSGQSAALNASDVAGLLNPGNARPPMNQTRSEASDGLAAGDVEYLLHQAEEALASVNDPRYEDPPPPVAPFRFEEFASAPSSVESATLELIRDVELDLKIELGRTQMYLEDVLKLRKGSVVPLDKLAGDPVDIFVNGRLIARGEVLVLNDNFCVRVAELIAGENPRPT